MITITPAAAKKIKTIIDAEDPSLKLRVFVEGGGCTGFKYGFSMEEQPPAEDDFTFEKDGVGVVIDSVSMQYMTEAEIDYTESMMGSNFTIRNPNVTATCGCGSSFAV
jgi:iron-sulfur cluster insertion protein